MQPVLRSPRAPVLLAVVSVFAALFLLNVRSLTSLDLGFNLEYGRSFIESGNVVDHAGFLYTLPPRDLPPDLRPEPGPGAWYDDEGSYRFVNANWLGQVLMAATHAAGGVTALVALATLLALTVHGFVYSTMRRMGVPVLVALAGLGLFALAAFERFNLRPEVFGFAILATQLWILAPLAADPHRGLRRSPAIALALLQVLAVNVHGYFLLGIALAGTILAERLVLRFRKGNAASRPLNQAGGVVLLLAALSLVNPWTWRGALLPLETLIYLWRHDVGGGHGDHPWSHILELHGPFSGSFPDGISDLALLFVFVLGGVGAIAALKRGKLSQFLMTAGMLLVTFSMVRNIAPAGIVIVPIALAAVVGGRGSAANRSDATRRITTVAASAIIVLLSVALAIGVVSNRFYSAEKVPMRFGGGLGRITLPIGAAQWLDEHLPGARIWCDINSSSTLRFFTDPHREVPINTNQWAYPPAVMAENQALRAGRQPFSPIAARYGIDAVVLRVSTAVPLFEALTGNRGWALVHVEGEHAVFMRSTGTLAKAAHELALENFRGDPKSYVAHQRELDPFVTSSLLPAGRILLEGGATDLAIAVVEAAVEELPDQARIWGMLGSAYASRADGRQRSADLAFTGDAERARECFDRALQLEPGYAFAKRGRDRIDFMLGSR